MKMALKELWKKYTDACGKECPYEDETNALPDD